MMNGNGLDLYTIWRIALRWCPIDARWPHLLDKQSTWGPAHELGHALIEPANRRSLENYGNCDAGGCNCPRERCDIAEMAAMIISSRLVRYAGVPALAEREVNDTEGYDLIDRPYTRRAARRLIRRLGLWPVPYTAARLESALIRRGLVPQPRRRPTLVSRVEAALSTLGPA